MNSPLHRPATQAKVGLLFIRRAIPTREAGKRPLSAQLISTHPLPLGVLFGVADSHLGRLGDCLNPESHRHFMWLSFWRRVPVLSPLPLLLPTCASAQLQGGAGACLRTQGLLSSLTLPVPPLQKLQCLYRSCVSVTK